MQPLLEFTAAGLLSVFSPRKQCCVGVLRCFGLAFEVKVAAVLLFYCEQLGFWWSVACGWYGLCGRTGLLLSCLLSVALVMVRFVLVWPPVVLTQGYSCSLSYVYACVITLLGCSFL